MRFLIFTSLMLIFALPVNAQKNDEERIYVSDAYCEALMEAYERGEEVNPIYEWPFDENGNFTKEHARYWAASERNNICSDRWSENTTKLIVETEEKINVFKQYAIHNNLVPAFVFRWLGI